MTRRPVELLVAADSRGKRRMGTGPDRLPPAHPGNRLPTCSGSSTAVCRYASSGTTTTLHVCRVAGEIDLLTVHHAGEGARGPAAAPRAAVIVDLTGVTYCAAAGVRVLLDATARARVGGPAPRGRDREPHGRQGAESDRDHRGHRELREPLRGDAGAHELERPLASRPWLDELAATRRSAACGAMRGVTTVVAARRAVAGPAVCGRTGRDVAACRGDGRWLVAVGRHGRR